MIDPNLVKEAEMNIPVYLNDGMLSKDVSYKKFVEFYLGIAKRSFQVAKHLFDISTNQNLKKQLDFTEDFECFLWVVVVSYYSMFYMANAALSKKGLKVGDKVPHKVTQDALIVYFIKNKKLAKYLFEYYLETKSEVLNLMNVKEEELLKNFELKAEELIATFDYQRRKRGDFQYNIKTPMKKQLAETLLKKSEEFLREINSVIEKISRF